METSIKKVYESPEIAIHRVCVENILYSASGNHENFTGDGTGDENGDNEL